jgi:hypothetical protein
MKRILLLATALAGLALAPLAAHASDIMVTGYDLSDGDAYGTGQINGYSYYDGPITLHVQNAPDITVYCADLSHELQSWVGYSYGVLDHDGFGNLISQELSNRIGHIAELGFAAAPTNGLLASAAQLAIWSLELNQTPTFYNASVQGFFGDLLADTFVNDGRWATALIPDGGWPQNPYASQQMVVGFSGSVPEPSTWAMMFMGFAGLGYAAFRQGRKDNLSRSIA